MANTQIDSNFRSRRSHTKSRHGCLECKRRRVKCDEKKPACSRCVSTLQKCKYAPFKLSLTRFVAQTSVLPSPPNNTDSASLCSVELNLSRICSPSARKPKRDRVLYIGHQTPITPDRSQFDLSDIGLYEHYLEHTGCTLTQDSRDRSVLHSRVPALAFQYKSVLHALLAVSAVCLCCDKISTGVAGPSDIDEALITGYRHYHFASRSIRALLSDADHQAVEVVVVSSALLVPFAAASQQVNDWLSRNLACSASSQGLVSTPRDIITMLRGVRVTFEALSGCVGKAARYSQPASATSQELEMAKTSTMGPESGLSCERHPMYSILAETSEAAFLALRSRIHHITAGATGTLREHTAAFEDAFDILDGIRKDIFLAQETLPQHTTGSMIKGSSHKARTFTWLGDYAGRPAIATRNAPLTRPLLAFLVRIPQTYLSHLLPLLEQRLKVPVEREEVAGIDDLSILDVLALDIYAHWSVLMFLVQEESWWIGTLPTITLSGMINKYGAVLAKQSCSQLTEHEHHWWPGRMLSIMQETTLRERM